MTLGYSQPDGATVRFLLLERGWKLPGEVEYYELKSIYSDVIKWENIHHLIEIKTVLHFLKRSR